MFTDSSHAHLCSPQAVQELAAVIEGEPVPESSVFAWKRSTLADWPCIEADLAPRGLLLACYKPVGERVHVSDAPCPRCGRQDCGPLRLVADQGAQDPRLASACAAAAHDPGPRYATLWRLACRMVKADSLCMGESAAAAALEEFLRQHGALDAH